MIKRLELLWRYKIIRIACWVLIITVILVFLIVGIPCLINYLILQPQQFDIVGDGTTWLSFWVAYIGAIASLVMIFVTLHVLQKQLEQNQQENKCNREANEFQIKQNRDIQRNVLKYQQDLQWLENFKITSVKYVTAINHNNFSIACNMLFKHPDKVVEITKDMLDAEFEAFLFLKLFQKYELNSLFLFWWLTNKRTMFIQIVKDIHLTSNNICMSKNDFIALKRTIDSCAEYSNAFKEMKGGAPDGDGSEADYEKYILFTINSMVENIKSLQMELFNLIHFYILTEEKRINNILLDDNNDKK